jgi:MFS family permease
LIAVTYGMVRYGYGLQLPQLAAEFSLSARTSGAIAAGSFAAYCVAALAAQRLIERRGARVVLWLAAGLAALGALLVALSWSAPTLALGVLVAGSAAGAASPAMVVAVVSTLRGPLVARAQAVVNAGTGIGVALTGAATLAAPQAWRPGWVLAIGSPSGRRVRSRLSTAGDDVRYGSRTRRCSVPSSPPPSPGSAAQRYGPSVAT